MGPPLDCGRYGRRILKSKRLAVKGKNVVFEIDYVGVRWKEEKLNTISQGRISLSFLS